MRSTILRVRSQMPASLETVLTWHSRPGAFERLTPSWAKVRVVAAEGGIAPGASKVLRLGVGPFSVRWTLRHQALANGRGFVDEQERGPFRTWRHEHHFMFAARGTSTLDDRLCYELPMGRVGRKAAGKFVHRQLDELFRYRHDQTRHDIACHARACGDSPRCVAITGTSGLIGGQLKHFLQAGGIDVYSLVRRPAMNDHEIFWNPETGVIDSAMLEGIDAVVHLAGTSVAGGRWSARRKQAILQSRVNGTTLLATTISTLARPPRVFVSASAVGFYGDGGDGPVDESGPKGEGFLADVCAAWENATAAARDAGIRVVMPRIGVVLSGAGGMLPLVARPVRVGFGGPLGSGDQQVSWIALDDLLGILLEALVNDELSGPVNAVAPDSVSNRAFVETLARILHRPSVFSVPASLLRLVCGQLADEVLLTGQAVAPVKLLAAGFRFSFPTLEMALRHELGTYDGRGGVDFMSVEFVDTGLGAASQETHDARSRHA